MKVIAYNASPRKHWNTAMLLESALNGAAAAGAETELVNLYDIDYKGCHSCFECKRIGGKNYGKCAVRDGLTPVLESFAQADAAIFGSPIYFWNMAGELRSLLERLWFPYTMYTKNEERSLFTGKVNTLFVFTSNAPEQMIKASGLHDYFLNSAQLCASTFHGNSDIFYSSETLQFDDYSKFLSDMFDPADRARRREEVFPVHLKDVYELGKSLIIK